MTFRIISPCLVLVGLLAFPSAAMAFDLGVSDMFRSISGAISGRKDQPRPTASTTTTIGIRGMDDGQQAPAGPASSEEFKMVEGWSASPNEATNMAQKRGLQSRQVQWNAAASPRTEEVK